MIIGIPRERKTLEKRVALTPDGASELVKHGHKVLIETNAGKGSFFEDELYINAGCEIVTTLEAVWTRSDMVVKVKEPDKEEYKFFRPGLVLFDYLHLASLPEVASELLKGKVTSVAYELVQRSDMSLPLLEPMSEIAGKLSVLNGSYALLSQNGGRGVLLGGSVGVEQAEVIVVGAGIAGRAACEVALGMGASVAILDVSQRALERVKYQFNNRVKTIFSTKSSLERETAKADLLIGAVLIPGAAAPKLITREMVRNMKKGAVIVDISIDQGGFTETIRPTSLDQPVYEDEGVIHYGVCNMPAQTPRTSTMALTAATLPYIKKIANLGLEKAMEIDNRKFDAGKHNELRTALCTFNGSLTNLAVSEALGIEYKSLAGLL